MYFAFTDEQAQFRASVRRFLRERAPLSLTRRLLANEATFDRGLWQALAGELGVLGLQVPVSLGGQGFTFEELGITLEEMGRALYYGPYFGSAVLTTQVLLNAASRAAQEAYLPGLASGQRIGTVAWAETHGGWDPAVITTRAVPRTDGYSLHGRKRFVLDGDLADLILVVARLDETHLGLFALEELTHGVTRKPLATIDGTRPLAELAFSDAPARLISAEDCAGALELSFAQACGGLACEMVGGMRALMESAVDYAKLRMQFGRPIGAFQAIKHKCADLLLEVELASAAACYAAAAIAADNPETPALAALAKATAADTYMRTAAECIQIHGGIGFTWDHDTHLWYKRAKCSEVLLGDARYHREHYVRAIEHTA